MNSNEYWKKREYDALERYISDEKEYDKQIKKIYQNQLDSIQKEIDGFYGRYASKEGITLAEAKKRVSKLDIAAYERKAKRYVKEKNFSDKANEEMRLYNATMRINRLELLKANIGLELISGHDELDKFMGSILKGRTEDELKRQAGILGKTIQDNAKLAQSIPSASFHNATFSDRIWMYQDLLKADLSKLLQSGLIQGKSSIALAKELKKHFNVSTSNAERLMTTEMRRVQTEVAKQSYEKNGNEEYKFLALNPMGACEVCKAIDGKHFKVKDMIPGENAPPMHPRCHCSTAPYKDYSELDALLDFIDKGGTEKEWNKLKNNRKTVVKSSRSGIISLKKPLKIDMQYFANIPPDKINKFLLKPGAKHAKEFFDVGYKENDYELLVNDLLNGFSNGEIIDRITFSNNAERFSIFMHLGVENKKRFRSVWQKDTPESEPRLITAHRED